MASSESPLLDIEVLMERIRQDVARRRELAAPKAAIEPARHYTPGTLLRFGSEGNAGPFLGAGWAQPEAGFQWTDGEVAEVVFAFAKPPGDLVVTFSAEPNVGGESTVQEVSASWNGIPVGKWSINEGKSFHALIFSHLTGGSSKGMLSFHVPGAFSPLSRNLSADPRRLGIKLHELVLRSAAELGFQ